MTYETAAAATSHACCCEQWQDIQRSATQPTFRPRKTKRAISWKMTPWSPKRAIKMASP